MHKTVIAIVGRPNVGKSSFFNYLARERISIVADTPGVTRDRIYAEVEWLGKPYVLIDTGGIEPESKDNLLQQMRTQAEIAIEMADVILFMVDGKEGLHPSDFEVADILRRANKPIIVAVNKSDGPDLPVEFYDFYQLGFEEIHAISAAQGLGMGDLLDKVNELAPEYEEDEDFKDYLKLAIIGKPNVGKSSLVNKITGQERSIVSNMAGTTRDTTDTPVENEYGNFMLLDTAGMRRKAKIGDQLERYSVLRATAAIERADICLVMIDAAEGPTEQDTKIAGLAHKAGKGIIICVNKWDLPAEEKAFDFNEMSLRIRETFAFMPYAEIVFISAKTGSKLNKLFETINYVWENCNREISTGKLNEIIGDAQQMMQAPSYKGRRLKISYAVQVATTPPSFALFVNDVELLHFSYERYLENQIRRAFDFQGTSIRIFLRSKNKSKESTE